MDIDIGTDTGMILRDFSKPGHPVYNIPSDSNADLFQNQLNQLTSTLPPDSKKKKKNRISEIAETPFFETIQPLTTILWKHLYKSEEVSGLIIPAILNSHFDYVKEFIDKRKEKLNEADFRKWTPLC